MEIKMYNMQGQETGTTELPPEIFEVPVKPAVLHEVVRAMLANRRKALAHTKTRGDVSGGGKKPWRQKGTGRARHGSIRSPIWVGGGITFGPRKDRNFSVKVNKKTRRLAIRMALSARAGEGKVLALQELKLPEGKTKEMVNLLKLLPVGKKPFVILPVSDRGVFAASRNLPSMRAVTANAIDLPELLNYDSVVLLKGTIPVLQKLYGKTSSV